MRLVDAPQLLGDERAHLRLVAPDMLVLRFERKRGRPKEAEDSIVLRRRISSDVLGYDYQQLSGVGEDL